MGDGFVLRICKCFQKFHESGMKLTRQAARPLQRNTDSDNMQAL
jgi:hypothetical protein